MKKSSAGSLSHELGASPPSFSSSNLPEQYQIIELQDAVRRLHDRLNFVISVLINEQHQGAERLEDGTETVGKYRALARIADRPVSVAPEHLSEFIDVRVDARGVVKIHLHPQISHQLFGE
jgi:hypothetical protein